MSRSWSSACCPAARSGRPRPSGCRPAAGRHRRARRLLAGEPDPVQRREQPVAGTVAGEDPAGAVAAVGGRREPDDQHRRASRRPSRRSAGPSRARRRTTRACHGDVLAPGDEPVARTADRDAPRRPRRGRPTRPAGARRRRRARPGCRGGRVVRPAGARRHRARGTAGRSRGCGRSTSPIVTRRRRPGGGCRRRRLGMPSVGADGLVSPLLDPESEGACLPLAPPDEADDQEHGADDTARPARGGACRSRWWPGPWPGRRAPWPATSRRAWPAGRRRCRRAPRGSARCPRGSRRGRSTSSASWWSGRAPACRWCGCQTCSCPRSPFTVATSSLRPAIASSGLAGVACDDAALALEGERRRRRRTARRSRSARRARRG